MNMDLNYSLQKKGENQMKELIKSIMTEIKAKYGNTGYIRISNDRFLNKVPPRLYELWYSRHNAMSIATIDNYYHSIYEKVSPDPKAESIFLKELIILRDELIKEFDCVKKDNRKESEVTI